VQEPDAVTLGGPGFPGEVLVLASHDPEQRALARAVQAKDADLRAVIEREPDVFENLLVRGIDLPEPLHGVDELRHGETLILHRLVGCHLARRS
jgi:hypothetical protein